MPVGLIQFDPFPPAGLSALPQAVYVREAWGDSWEHVPFLYCDECTWSVAPQISTAVLRWRFGQAIQPGTAAARWYDRLTNETRANHRWYVKISYGTHRLRRGIGNPLGGVELPTIPYPPLTSPISWVGTFEIDQTILHGASPARLLGLETGRNRTGETQIICYGLEQMLANCPIDRSYWTDANGREHVAHRPFVFNAPNAVGELLGNVTRNGRTFTYLPNTTPPSDATEWTTRRIVRYLIRHFPPQSHNGRPVIPLTLADEAVLPDNDRPVLDPTGMSLWECLCHLVAPQRLLGFYLHFASWNLDPVIDDWVRIQPFTLVDEPQAGEGYVVIPANPNQFRIDFDLDADVQDAGVKTSSVKEVDQIVLRGARRTSTCSLSDADGTLQPGWNIGTVEPDEEDYEAAASTQVDYPLLATDEQQRLNAEVRSSEALFAVYRYFVHPGHDWDQLVGDGEGGAKTPLFPERGLVGNRPYRVWPRELYVLPGLMLQEGMDYSYLGTVANPIPPAKIDNRPRNRTAPLVFFRTPKRYRVTYSGDYLEIKDHYWIEASKIGDAAQIEEGAHNENHRWSCRVEVPNQSYGLLVHVEGQPQHVIAKSDFTPLPVDEVLGDFDWRHMIVTCSFEDDRHCEGRWPPDASILPTMINAFLVGLSSAVAGAVAASLANQTQVRRHIIYVGDQYRQDWLCPGTVIGVNPQTGALIRNPDGGWLQNDEDTLTKRARQIFRYFGKRRRSLMFSTSRINTILERGMYITAIGGITSQIPIGSVITQIRIVSPEGEHDAPPPRIHYETSYLELEALAPS